MVHIAELNGLLKCVIESTKMPEWDSLLTFFRGIPPRNRVHLAYIIIYPVDTDMVNKRRYQEAKSTKIQRIWAKSCDTKNGGFVSLLAV